MRNTKPTTETRTITDPAPLAWWPLPARPWTPMLLRTLHAPLSAHLTRAIRRTTRPAHRPRCYERRPPLKRGPAGKDNDPP